MALKVRTMKLDDATWERWQAEAKAAGVSVAALIILRMEAGPAVAKVKVGELEADIVELERLLARVTGLEQQAALFSSKEIGWEKQSRASADVIAKQALKIATLEKALAAAPKPVASILPVTGTEFPARQTYLRGQAPTKGKGKR